MQKTKEEHEKERNELLFPQLRGDLFQQEFGFSFEQLRRPCRLGINHLARQNIENLKPIIPSTVTLRLPDEPSATLNHTNKGRFVILKIKDSIKGEKRYVYDVEDEVGVRCQLILNIPFDIGPLRVNDYVLVKEPKLLDQGTVAKPNQAILVWHRSDWKLLTPQDEVQWGLQATIVPKGKYKSRMILKEEGNAFFSRDKFEQAIRKYNEALLLTSDTSVPDEVLLRNRSRAERRLGLGDTVERTLRQALLAKPNDPKTDFELAKSLYCLRRYEESSDIVAKLLKRRPTLPFHREVQSLSTKLKKRQSEVETGAYDFTEMFRDGESMLTGKAMRVFEMESYGLDYADYNGPCEIRDIPPAEQHLTLLNFDDWPRSKGIFATRDIKFGELVMCQKAIVFILTKDLPKSRQSALELEHALTTKISDKIHDNLQLAKRFYSLYHAGKGYGCEHVYAHQDDRVVTETAAIVTITRLNRFGGNRIEPDENEQPHSQEYAPGVWDLPSYANHSCLPNIHPTYVGDMMILRAATDIPRGAQLCVNFGGGGAAVPLQFREVYFANNWNIRCNCNLCVIEREEIQAKPNITTLRREYNNQLDPLKSVLRRGDWKHMVQPGAGPQLHSVISGVKGIIAKLEASYANTPRKQYRTEMYQSLWTTASAFMYATGHSHEFWHQLQLKLFECIGFRFNANRSQIVDFGCWTNWEIVYMLVNVSLHHRFLLRSNPRSSKLQARANYWKETARKVGIVGLGCDSEFKRLFKHTYEAVDWDQDL